MSARQYREHRARDQFQRKLEQLRFELRVHSPRRVLDYLLDHLTDLLPECGDSLLTETLNDQLARARRIVASRHNLRVVREERIQ